MKKNVPRRLPYTLWLIVFMLFVQGPVEAKIEVQDEDDMLLSSDLIALVDIVELRTTDKATPYADLMAKAQLTHLLKGVTMKTELEIRIPRFFPCAAFDMSTGMHLVFLQRDKSSGKLVGTNWYMSYVYLGAKKARWYDKNGVRIEAGTPEDLIKRVKMRIAEAAEGHKKRKAIEGELQLEGKPAT